jgi:UDP-N-acetylglucosamine--N-acetylmuramyl-(pentapeptide) pyrophosphoryl-undecaprenol N-acetylglucosamine transferase
VEAPDARAVLLTGGGTAGHVTPNLALLPGLTARGFTVEYMGDSRGIERRLAEQAGVRFHGISTGKLRRYFSWQNFVDPFRIVLGVLQATWRIARRRPALVFSKGGFVGVPVVIAAWLNRVPVIVHESDLTPGLANRLSFPFARRICLSFAETADRLPGRDVIYTGTPVRRDLLQGDRAGGVARFGLDPARRTLLVFGGSQGARALNEQVRALLERLPDDLQILHVCGPGNLAPDLEGRSGYRQYEYLAEEFADAFACADVVLSRAGANSLAELIALRKPAIVVPLPTAASRGDQIDNARVFAEKGYGLVLPQSELTTEKLCSEIQAALERADDFVAAMDASESHDPVTRILDLIEELAR